VAHASLSSIRQRQICLALKRRNLQVGILTGQSDPARCGLSPAQQAFLDAMVPRALQIPQNFPYDSRSAVYRHSSLLKASLNNGWLYFRSRSHAFRRRHQPTLESLLSQSDATIFIAGSCGLELFNNLALPPLLLSRVQIVAYGPVARRRPNCRHELIGARGDAISRRFFPRPDHSVDCSHLGYLANDDVRMLCSAFVSRAMS
jgi:hypothetical protein